MRHAPAYPNYRVSFVWVLFISMWLIGDTATTIIGLELGGRETSTLIRTAIHYFGYPGMIGLKLSGLVGLVLAGYVVKKKYVHGVALLLGFVASIAVVWNTIQILYYYGYLPA